MAELKLKKYRILPKYNCTEIKILFMIVENNEKCLQSKKKLEEEGFLIQTTEKQF